MHGEEPYICSQTRSKIHISSKANFWAHMPALPGQQSKFAYDWYSANIGGNYPILSCSKYGCTCQALSATRSGKQVLLSGRFGVFYGGRLAIEFVDAHGRTVGAPALLDRVSPLHPLVLNSVAIAAPANAIALRIVIYGLAMKRLGELAQAFIPQ